MGQVLFTRPRGATLRFELFDPDAQAGDEAKITMKAALLAQGARTLVADTSTSSAEFEISYREATDDVDKGWTAEISATACAELLGNRHYQLDGFRVDGDVITPVLEPAILFLREAAFA